MSIFEFNKIVLQTYIIFRLGFYNLNEKKGLESYLTK